MIRPTQQSLSFSHNFRTLITWTLLHFNGQPVQVFALASPSSTVQQAALRRQSSPLSTPATPPSPNCSLIALWPNPCLVVPTPPSPTDAYLPYFSKIALLSEAELSRLLPLPPRNRSFPHACKNSPRLYAPKPPSVIQTHTVNTTLGGAFWPQSPTPSGISVAAAPVRVAHETWGGARSPPPSPTGRSGPTPSGASRSPSPLPLPLTRRGAAHVRRGTEDLP